MVVRSRGWALPLGAATACTAAQSARTVAPGRTELTVAGARTGYAEDREWPHWTADVMVRQGLAENLDIGARALVALDEEPARWAAVVEPKVQVTRPGSLTTLSFAIGGGVASSGGERAYLVLFSAYVGVAMSPTAELVVAPRLQTVGADVADDRSSATRTGVSIGVRFTDERRRWALHPEVGVVLSGDGPASATFGLAVTAGR